MEQIAPNVVSYQEMDDMDHTAFNYGRDAKLVNSVVDLINKNSV